MNTTVPHDALAGKVVLGADVIPNKDTGDAEFVLRFTDGTTAIVGAWQTEGYPIEMSVDIAPVKQPKG